MWTPDKSAQGNPRHGHVEAQLACGLNVRSYLGDDAVARVPTFCRTACSFCQGTSSMIRPLATLALVVAASVAAAPASAQSSREPYPGFDAYVSAALTKYRI